MAGTVVAIKIVIVTARGTIHVIELILCGGFAGETSFGRIVERFRTSLASSICDVLGET